MNCVDSSGYLEYFTNSPNANVFAPIIIDLPQLIVPTICIYEVFKKILIEHDAKTAQSFAAQMMLGRVIDLDQGLAVKAAILSRDHKLPMADAIMYATAQSQSAVLWTQDQHFKNLPGVQFKPKQP